MADDFDTQTEDWDLDELLKEFEPEVEEAEKKADDQVAKVTKGMRKIAERQAKLEEQARTKFPVLSMGMSHDYEVAVEEGATIVRVGSAIFGSR